MVVVDPDPELEEFGRFDLECWETAREVSHFLDKPVPGRAQHLSHNTLLPYPWLATPIRYVLPSTARIRGTETDLLFYSATLATRKDLKPDDQKIAVVQSTRRSSMLGGRSS